MHLNKLYTKYANQGLTVILVTQDSEKESNAFATFKQQVPFKIFGNPKSTGSKSYNHKYIPHIYLINADGTLAWQGEQKNMSERKIDDALSRRIEYFTEKFANAPRSAIGKLMAGRLADAYTIAQKAAKTEKKEDAKEGAKKLADSIETIVRRQLAHAKVLYGDREYLQSYVAYQAIKNQWESTEFAKQAAEQIKEFKKENVQKELTALQQLDSILRSYSGKASKNNMKEGSELLDQFAKNKRYSGTKAASKAAFMSEVFEEAAK